MAEPKKSSEEKSSQEKAPKKKSSKKKKALKAFGILLVILAALAGAVYYMGHRYYAETNYVTDEEAVAQIEAAKAAAAEEEEESSEEDDEEEEEEEEVDPDLLEAREKMQKYASEADVTTNGNVYNVLLIGLDATGKNGVGRSDSMILISINYDTRKISMISFMRDLHVYIPGVGYRKLNAAYPNGGGPLLCETLKENFAIDVDRYAVVEFGDMINIVDEIGTIELTFTEAEAENANKSIKQQCRILGLKAKDYLIPGEGTYECNGMQAVAYARIRKVGNADYQRTQRQREVLMKLLTKIKAMDLDDLDSLATRILPMVTHNVPESEFWSLVAKAPTLFQYNIIQDRVPYDGMYTSYSGDLVADAEGTIAKLNETLYGDPEGLTEDDEETSDEDTDDDKSSGSEDADEENTDDEDIDEDTDPVDADDDDADTDDEDADDSGEPVSICPDGEEKYAAVIADNTETEDEVNENFPIITNPYAPKVFLMDVELAKEASTDSIVSGHYYKKSTGTDLSGVQHAE